MITTITLNPALDRLLSTGEIEMGEANRVERKFDFPAGKGVDVAKVLSDMGREVSATGFLGGHAAGAFEACFTRKGIRNAFVSIAGETRVNIQLFEEGGRRTELLEQGPIVSADECRRLNWTIEALAPQSRVVTLCGSAPRGISLEYYCELIRNLKEHGCIVIVDASGKLLPAALEEKPHMIKPNRYEMQQLMGKPDATDEEIIAYGRNLVEDGIPYVMVSLGGDGSMLICKEGVYKANAPKVDVQTTLGCGDTAVASMAMSFYDGLEPAEMLRNAAALATANCMTFETAHVTRANYEYVLPQVHVEKIG